MLKLSMGLDLPLIARLVLCQHLHSFWTMPSRVCQPIVLITMLTWKATDVKGSFTLIINVSQKDDFRYSFQPGNCCTKGDRV